MKKMKDSCIDWIGQIPAHWTVKKAKYIFEKRYQKKNLLHLPKLSSTNEFGVIPQTLFLKKGGSIPTKASDENLLKNSIRVCPGDFCITFRSFENGFEYSAYDGIVSEAYKVFFAKEPIIDGYFKYLFKTPRFTSLLQSYSTGLKNAISFLDFANTNLPIPPLEEQQAIVHYLDELDALIKNKYDQLALLTDYNQTIMFDVLTGKKEINLCEP